MSDPAIVLHPGAVPAPSLVSIEMGYGHLRAAKPIATQLGIPLYMADEAPLADSDDQLRWQRARKWYEIACRLSESSVVGLPLRSILEGITFIDALHPYRDLSQPNLGVRGLRKMIRQGLGRSMVEQLRKSGAPLVTTFYAPAIVADEAGLDRIFCIVTDSDINRIWAPFEPQKTRIRYLAPSPRVVRRLRAYGVPASQIDFTGFPLPGELLGGESLAVLRKAVAQRLVRLDPLNVFRRSHTEEVEARLGPLPQSEARKPPLLTFPIGGAGAQTEMVPLFLAGLAPLLREGRLRLALVAGVRKEVLATFESALADAGLSSEVGRSVELLYSQTFDTYFESFNALLSRTDILWTKPSELTFYGALGIPIVCARPMGVHERYNQRWLRELGAGLKQRDPRFAAEWLINWLEDGTLALAAWSGFTRMPQHGLYEIEKIVTSGARSR